MFIPDSTVFCRSSANTLAVIAMIGIVLTSCRSSTLILTDAAQPSITGIRI
ncbi:hypothetical protein [Hungatella effluvii]|uniref:hypothetical protein n=1 Tax=Hungatella effluvii TaxID=1096246 RepID=UPI0016519F28|nr:hypothetical protein [Hungatella effluvii]